LYAGALRRGLGVAMTKREVVRTVLQHKIPPYVPWEFPFTEEAFAKLTAHYGDIDVGEEIGNHCVRLGASVGFFREIGADHFQDVFGVVWDRHIDKDIGNIEGQVLPEPTMAGYRFPDPTDPRYFADIPEKLEKYPDRFRVFDVGFSLYERAWTMRGMEPLLMDFVENPEFAHELLDRICDYNIAHVTKALEYDIDAVHFGDDWGSQHGLIMGPRLWKKFIQPRLKRMYDVVLAAGKFVSIHSCGDVDELFDPLLDIGLSCFNPFQPEVMDVYELLPRYRGRLSFHGGLSTQKTLPFGSVDDVRRESRRLLELGSSGGYIFSPAHAVEQDVPLENMLAFIDEANRQPGFKAR
jgi:uroporphyrinogen decarboxylase